MPPTVADILTLLEKIAPTTLAESWDNVGLQVGRDDEKTTGILVALDVSLQAIATAKSQKCNVLIVHHPFFFKPLQKIDLKTPQGQMLREALAANLQIIVVHTNFDRADKGLNDEVSKHLRLKKVRPLDASGLGRIGNLSKKRPLKRFIAELKQSFGIPAVRWVGQGDPLVERVALCGGSGAFLIDQARRMGADVFLTGDIKYHDALDALHAQWGEVKPLSVVDVGHFAFENFAMQKLGLRLGMALKSKRVNVEFFERSKDPFTYF